MDILQENKAREDAVTLQDRIAQIEAVKILLTKRIDTLKEGDITRILELLNDNKTDFPFQLKSGLTGRMLDFKFDFIITNACVRFSAAHVLSHLSLNPFDFPCAGEHRPYQSPV